MKEYNVHRNPLVSVVMPLYNCEQFVHAAIDSILAQTFTNFEFLIIDDGSTDDSLSIARSYTDSRIQLLAEPHEGLVTTLNKGLSLARGKYIARMDADDISLPRRLAKQIAIIESSNDVVLVGCCARCIDIDGKPTGNYVIPPVGGKNLAVALCASNQFVHGSTVMRTQAALAVGGYRDAFLATEDYDLWLRLGEIGQLAHLPAFLYQLRTHPHSKSAHEGDRRRRNYVTRAQQYAVQRRLHGRDDLGYAAPPLNTTRTFQPALNTVALTDWSQICLWQGKVQLAIDILQQAASARDSNAQSLSVMAPMYLSEPYAREILRSFYQGTWANLGRTMIKRLISRVVEKHDAVPSAIT